MSKVLVVAYSYTGTSLRLAQLLAGLQQWTLAEVREAGPRSGAAGTWRCVMDSLLRRTPAIRYEGPDPAAFDAVVLVSPIWAYRLAGPMRSFVATRRDSLPDVAMISVMGERGAANAVAEVTRLLGRAPLMDTAFKTREVEDGSCGGRLQAFGRAVQQAKDNPLIAREATWSPRAA
ncbi:MAG TPA: flavodoxin [Albitalea sp.]|nr:flavodoxin [Albitalea sp.]